MSAGTALARPWAAVVLVAALLLAGPPVAAQSSDSSDPPDPGAQGAVVWEPATEAVLFDRDARVGRPMASTTKIMTALLALEAGTYGDEVEVSAEAAEIGRVPGGATLGLAEGATVPMRSLLAGLVLVSGNDAAVAVADHVAGGEGAFVDEMNDRADELALDQTNFVNSSGLTDDRSHRASPLDLARLADVAMADERFAELAGAESLDADGLGTLHSRNELLGTYPGATGVKTGYTALAGRSLVASAERDGRVLYAVVLGAEDSFADAAMLLDHGFEDFRRLDVADDEPVLTYRWADAEAPVVPAEPLTSTVAAKADVSARLDLHADVERPAPAGAPAGQLTLVVDGQEQVTVGVELAAAAEEAAAAEPTGQLGSAIADTMRGLGRLRPVDVGLP